MRITNNYRLEGLFFNSLLLREFFILWVDGETEAWLSS
jgi:hypothetical protein